jgi:hypothetical protein
VWNYEMVVPHTQIPALSRHFLFYVQKTIILRATVDPMTPCSFRSQNYCSGSRESADHRHSHKLRGRETVGAAEDQRRKDSQIEPGAQVAGPCQNHQVSARRYPRRTVTNAKDILRDIWNYV